MTQIAVCSPEQEQVRKAVLAQRTHLRRVLEHHEQERAAVARRLLELAGELLCLADSRDPAASGQRAELLHELSAQAARLHPPRLGDGGIATALERLADGVGRRELRPVSVAVEAGAGGLSPDVALALYRTVEDALAATHGPLQVRLRRLASGWLRLVVVVGAAGVSGHVVRAERLALARARVALLGGTLEVRTPRAGGLLLYAEIPVAD